MNEITVREEFAKMNELTSRITLSLGVQARVPDMSPVDSLEGTEVWEYDSVACPQMIVQLDKGLMKIYTNQTDIYEDKDQAAGLVIAKSFILSGHQAYTSRALLYLFTMTVDWK